MFLPMPHGAVMFAILAFAIGVIAGLRAFTAPALVAWAAHLGWLNIAGSSLAFVGSAAAVGVLTLLAIGELVTDKLPKAPNRTEPLGLVARFVTGALSGAAVAVSGGGMAFLLGGILGALGGIAGAFAGYQARTRLVKALKVPDFVIAVLEDAVAIGGGFWIVSRF